MPGLPEAWADQEYCYITTAGGRTGRPHTIEIWFAWDGGRVYILSGERTDWVRNLCADPRCTIRVGDDVRQGRGRVVTDPAEAAIARRIVPVKYASRQDGLEEWAAGATPVAIEE